MANNPKPRTIFKSIRGGKCHLCNIHLQNLQRHYNSNGHKNLMKKKVDTHFEYKKIIQILKHQKKLIDRFIRERINVKNVFKSFKNELIDCINRCIEFANSLEKYEKNIILGSEIKILTKNVEKAASEFFILKSNDTENDLFNDLEILKDSNKIKNKNYSSLKEVNKIFGENSLETNGQLIEQANYKKIFVKKFGLNRSQKLIDFIRPFYKTIDNKRLFILKNHFCINLIENIIIDSLMKNVDKKIIKNMSEDDLTKFCNDVFDNFYNNEARQYEGAINPQDTLIENFFV